MFGFFDDDHKNSYDQVYGQQDHEGKFSHELVAGAASFGAVKVYEDRQRREGKPVSHAFAKELIAGIAGGEVDKLFETKGLDYLDRDQVRRDAQDHAQQAYDSHYGGQDQWRPDYQAPVDYQQRY